MSRFTFQGSPATSFIIFLCMFILYFLMSTFSWSILVFNLIEHVIMKTKVMGEMTIAALKYLDLMGFFKSY